MSSETGPLSVSCPDCKARKGKPCVYIWPKDWDGSPKVRHSWTSVAVQAQMDKAGTPTKRPHNGRYHKIWLKEQVARKKARDAAYAAKNAAGRDRDAILRANAQAVSDEHAQLLDWLRKNARILTSPA